MDIENEFIESTYNRLRESKSDHDALVVIQELHHEVKALQDRLTAANERIEKLSFYLQNRDVRLSELAVEYGNAKAECDQLRAKPAEQTTPAESVQCDHDWEDVGNRLECTYPGCGAVRMKSPKVDQVSGGSESVVMHDDIREAIALIYDTCKHVSDSGMFPSDNKELLNLRQIKKISTKLLSLHPSPNKADVPVEFTDADIDRRLGKVLKASGSALAHFTMHKTRHDMRAAMREAITLPPLKDE